MRVQVQVQSVIMGYGKSTNAISMIKSEPDNFYFVMLPYLDEVKRYKQKCNKYLPQNNQLIEPSDKITGKSANLLNNLKSRNGSVVTTHAMFENLTGEHINAIKRLPKKRGEKVLLLDETIDLVKAVSGSRISHSALQADVENEYIVVCEATGKVQWNCLKEFDSQGAYPHHEYLRNLCDTGMLYFLDSKYVVMEVPMNFLECFDRVIVMTYRWSSSIMANYLRVNGVDWEMLTLNQERVMEVYKYIVKHLVIPDEYSIDTVGLSKSGIEKDLSTAKKLLNQNIKQAMSDYEIDIEEVLYTTLKSAGGEDLVKWFSTLKIGRPSELDSRGRKKPKAFLAHNILGTNKYQHCRLMVYGLSKHIHPGISSFFSKHGSSIDTEAWALSSMLQWLFRGCIRDHDSGEVMIAVILCPRMRRLAQEWLKDIKRQVREG
ncbi:hypothetical protein [Billgrantia antri]|uniref:hypothetical protein n=1 Tax=Billgrantia antri TaxID=2846777 RepID=UPI003B20C0B3